MTQGGGCFQVVNDVPSLDPIFSHFLLNLKNQLSILLAKVAEKHQKSEIYVSICD